MMHHEVDWRWSMEQGSYAHIRAYVQEEKEIVR